MGGGGDTTNVTNTGLGDDQFRTLTANQSSIGTRIDQTRADAGNRFNVVDNTLSGIRGDVRGVTSNLSSGLATIQNRIGQSDQAAQRGFATVGQNINQATGQIQTGMRTGFDGVNKNLTTGFGTMDERFNRVDTAQQTAQTAIDTGFQDTANNFSDLNTRLTDDFTAAQQTMDTGFADVGEGLNDLDTNTQNRLDTVQGNVLTGQALLDQGITGMSDAQDIYYGDLSNRQMEIQQGQDGFQSTFDDYVQRYSEDTTLANQTRADIQTGLVNATDRIRTDMGNFAQAAATGDATLSSQLSDTERANRDALGNLNTAVQGGFTGQAMANQQAQQNLVTRLGNLGSMVDTVGSTLDTNTRQQYSSLMSSFDDSGNLIRNSIDAQGNTIQRSMDNQGNLVLSRFDQAGTQIDQVGMNVNDMLTNAERYQQSLTGQIGDFQSTTDQGFTQVRREIGTNFDLGQQQAASLFDAQRGAISRQGLDIINTVGSQIGNLDQSAQQQYQSLSQAFDQNGNLVTQSVDDLGNSISRQMDENGNLTIRRLDQTGRMIDQSSLNVTGLLSDLGTRTGTLQNTQTSLADSLNQGFAETSTLQQQAAQAQQQGMDALRQGQDRIGQTTNQGFSDLGQGLMSTQQAGMEQFQQLQGSIGQGFNATSGTLDVASRNLASLAAQQDNLDQGMRSQFVQLASSFDENGNLIRSSIDEQGNTIGRSIDAQGNLVISRFDQAGNQIDQVGLGVNDVISQAQNLQNQIGSFQSTADQGFGQLQQSLGTGFSTAQQQAASLFDTQRSAISRQGLEILNTVGSQLGNLDQATQQQYQSLSQAFDANGNLVAQSVDDLGNSISRQMDQNGNLTIRRLDETGRQIDQSNINVTSLLGDLGNRTGTLQNTQTSLADRLDQGFASMSDRQQGGFDALQRGQERLGQTTGQGFSDVNQGLMAAQQNNMTQLQRMSTDIMSGFDAANGVMDTQTRDIAKVAAQQGNLNDNMRQQFNQIGDAFDDNGRLIQNSILNNGNIISRNIDDNGNLLLRAFDTTGRTIGNQVVNINRALVDLSQLDFYAGANVSMGNLSPAMRGAVPTSGFASPFTTTR